MMKSGKGKTGNGGRSTGSSLRPLFATLLLIALTWLSGSVVLADVAASLHMSVSPGGDPVSAVQSGTATVFAVLTYQDAAQTELQVLVFSAGGVVLFQHTDVYDGSGERSIEITGQDILAGYVSAALDKSTELEEAVSMTQQAATASAKRVRAASVVNVVRTLDSVLAALETYPLSLETLDDLEKARDLAFETDEQGSEIMTDVPDDQLDAAIAELVDLVTETVDAVDTAVAGIDTNTQQAWPDGAYTIQLRRNGQISVGFDWEVSPEGVPGTPVVSPTPTVEPTATPVPTETQQPTATATARPATATSRPTSVATRPMSPTPLPTHRPLTLAPTVTPVPPVQSTTQAQPTIPLPPTVATKEQAQVVPASLTTTPIAEGQTGYPMPPLAMSNIVATPVVQAPAEVERMPEQQMAGEAAGSQAPIVPGVTPLAPQEVRQFPVIRVIAVVSALVFGLVALWLRARV